MEITDLIDHRILAVSVAGGVLLANFISWIVVVSVRHWRATGRTASLYGAAASIAFTALLVITAITDR